MLAATFRCEQTLAATATKQAQRHANDDESQTSDGMHDETPHVIGVGKVIEVDNNAGASGGQARNRFEQGVQVSCVMPRQEQGDRGEICQNDPCQANDGDRLLTRKRARLDTAETKRRSRNESDAHCQQIARRGAPLVIDDGGGEGDGKGNG